MSSADELAKLASLRDQGVLTEDEFRIEKGRLLAGLGSAPTEQAAPAPVITADSAPSAAVSSPPPPGESADPAGNATRRGSRRTRLLVAAAVVVVAAIVVVLVLVLSSGRKSSPGPASASGGSPSTSGSVNLGGPSAPAPPTAALTPPRTIGDFSLNSTTESTSSVSFEANYARANPEGGFTLFAISGPSPAQAAQAAQANLTNVASSDFPSHTPVTTTTQAGITYSCFTATDSSDNPVAICGWSHRDRVFLITVLIGPTNIQTAVSLASQATQAVG